MKFKWIYAVIAIAILSFVRISDPWLVEILRLKSLDMFFRNQESLISENITIVEIDENALKKYGQWPWDRKVLSEQLDRINSSGASALVLPIVFAEPDRFGGDQRLATTISSNHTIVAQTATTNNNTGSIYGNPVPRGVAAIGEDWKPWIYEFASGIGPIKEIADVSSGVGMLLSTPEADGVVRRLPVAVQINGEIYPSLPIETLRVAAGDPSYQLRTGVAGIEGFRIPNYNTIITDGNGRVWIDFRWNAPTQSITDETLNVKDKIVFVAVTAEGLNNTVATPVGIRYGHELNAAMLETLIQGTTIQRPYWADFGEITYAIIIALLVCAVLIYLNWYVGIIVFPLTVYITYYITNYLFVNSNLLVDWSWPIVTIFVAAFVSAFVRFISEFKQKMQIKKQFGTYLSPALVAKLQKNPELLKLGGETRDLSIMFTDVRGFTAISEHYGQDVQGLTNIMNRYMTAMTAKILDNNGTLDKYIGDAQMAFWNAPLDDKEHAKHAVYTAIEMLRDLDTFNNQLSDTGTPPFGMGIGINSGCVVVGNMGSNQRFDYTCLGDSVNLASRLEGQSKNYGVKLILGQNTVSLLDEPLLMILELDKIAVKGKTEGVNIYTCLGYTKEFNLKDNTQNLKLHNKFIDAYRKQKWDEAIEIAESNKFEFNKMMTEYYDMMIGRCKEYKDNPMPKDWDGTYKALTK